METEEREAEELEDTNAEPGDENGNNKEDSKTWYPYITKAQFEKFLARLQSRIPEEIDRDYVRAIIRTPSMIYRFLRGIEAMKLIDRDQKPTARLQNLVNQDSRRRTIGEIVEDLYPYLLKYYQADGGMADRDIVSFFRKETGMVKEENLNEVDFSKIKLPSVVDRFLNKFVDAMKGANLNRMKRASILYKVIDASGMTPQQLMADIAKIRKELK